MGRDHRKLRVFTIADALVVDVYRFSRLLPPSERYGLQIQLRRAAVSVATNIVEGSARKSTREYLRFLNVAAASAAEAAYLAALPERLGLLDTNEGRQIAAGYGALVARIQALIIALSHEP